MRPRACEARIVSASRLVHHLKLLCHHQRRSRPVGRGRASPSVAYFFRFSIFQSCIRIKRSYCRPCGRGRIGDAP